MPSSYTATMKCYLKAEILFAHLTRADIQHPVLSGVSMTCHFLAASLLLSHLLC